MEKLMINDFPAAHSMDTTWFAVDADGNIGVFDSWEGGAVPEPNPATTEQDEQELSNFIQIWNADSLFWEWSQENEDCIVRLKIPAVAILKGVGVDLQSSKQRKRKRYPKLTSLSDLEVWINQFERSDRKQPEKWYWSDWSWLVSIADEEKNLSELLAGWGKAKKVDREYVVKFEGIPVLLLLKPRPSPILKTLFKKGILELAIPLKRYRDKPEKLGGFFYYAHSEQYPAPYECEDSPFYPLNIRELPEKMQSWVARNRFESLNFHDTRKIQPLEHMRCDTWERYRGSTRFWRDCEGNERFGYPYD